MNKRKKERLPVHAAILVYLVACFVLFYNQSIADLTVTGDIPYQSDLPLHISMIVEDGWSYSFTGYIYKALYFLCGRTTIGIAGFLTLVSVATVYVTEMMVCYLGKIKEKTWYTLALALSLNFVMPIYVSAIGEFRYVSYQSGNIWHNSTYLSMRLAGLLTVWYYLKLREKYAQGITVKEWLVFALLNIICTGIKPSVLIAYSPIVGLFLLIDLFQKVPFKNILIFGSALLPSGGVILWQNAVLFGEDTGNGMAFKPWYNFSLHTNIPKLAVVCSALFCGVVILLTLKEVWKDTNYLFLILMTGVGFMEALCLVENGSRSVDGNFLWGYSFCLFCLFTVCAVKALTLLPDKQPITATTSERALWLRKIGAVVMVTVIYAAHLYCGLYFFCKLVSGVGFYMR